MLSAADWSALTDLQPLAARAAEEDPAALIRLRLTDQAISGFIRMPFDVLAGRTMRRANRDRTAVTADLTMTALDLCDAVLSDRRSPEFTPTRRDAGWLSPLPPLTGWQRLELVPEHVVRQVVQANLALHQANVAGSRSAQRTLLQATVLTVATDERAEDIPLRALTALTKLGFLPAGGAVAADQARGWLRLAAAWGSTFVPAAAGQLNLLLG